MGHGSVLSKALCDDLAVVSDPGGRNLVVEEVSVAVERYAASAVLGAIAE